MSLGEIVLLLLVGIIVVGPRNLPTMMRTAGQWVARLRRMSTELRTQSGIDDLLRREGLDEHLHQLRSLSRLNVVDTLMAGAGAASPAPTRTPNYSAPSLPVATTAKSLEWKRREPLREREYPLVGCDAFGALADDVAPYVPTPPVAPAEPAHAPVAEVAVSAPVAPAEPAPEPPADAPPDVPADVAPAPAAIEAP